MPNMVQNGMDNLHVNLRGLSDRKDFLQDNNYAMEFFSSHKDVESGKHVEFLFCNCYYNVRIIIGYGLWYIWLGVFLYTQT